MTDNFDGRRVPVKEAERRAGPYPYYGASGVVDHVDGYIFEGEYLLIAEDGENLRTRSTPIAFLARDRFWVNNHAHIVRGNAHADTRYLMYALAATEVSGYLTGSTMPKLTQGNLNRVPLPVPPLDVQRRIVGVLGSLDDKIELNRKMSETLETMARALFKSWFVDFDPVRAKSEERSSGLEPLLAELFPSSLSPVGTDTIPAGWHIGKLRDLANHLRQTLNPAIAPATRFAYYSIPAFDLGRMPVIEDGASIMSNKFVFRGPVVLLSKLNPTIERVWLARGRDDDTSICSTEFLVLAERIPDTLSFIYCLALSSGFRDSLASLVTGTSNSHQRARPDSILDLPIILPPLPVIKAFAAIADPILSRIAVGRTESQTLTSLRDLLLPKLISGELRVPDAEEILSEELSA